MISIKKLWLILGLSLLTTSAWAAAVDSTQADRVLDGKVAAITGKMEALAIDGDLERMETDGRLIETLPVESWLELVDLTEPIFDSSLMIYLERLSLYQKRLLSKKFRPFTKDVKAALGANTDLLDLSIVEIILLAKQARLDEKEAEQLHPEWQLIYDALERRIAEENVCLVRQMSLKQAVQRVDVRQAIEASRFMLAVDTLTSEQCDSLRRGLQVMLEQALREFCFYDHSEEDMWAQPLPLLSIEEMVLVAQLAQFGEVRLHPEWQAVHDELVGGL